MTEQYQQTNINQPMSGARYVDLRDVNAVAGGVPLNADDEWIIASDFDDVTAFTLILPDVAEVEGKDIIIQNRLVPPSAVAVTVAGLGAQTINGAATAVLAAAGDTIVLRADPPDNTVDPVTQPTNWSIIRGPSAP